MANDTTDNSVNKLSDAELAAKTGFGDPAEDVTESEENATESEEETEKGEEEADDEESDDSDSEAEKDEADENEAEIDEEEESEEDDEESSEANESDDEAEEDESEDEDEEEEESDKKIPRTVPYSKLKSKENKIKQLQKEIADLKTAKAEAKDEGDKDEVARVQKEIEDTAKKLGEELGMDDKAIAKILEAGIKLSSKKTELPKEIQDKLKAFDELLKQSEDQKESAHFEKEWNQFDIKKQYPNATKAAILEARKLMDDLSHSKDFHKYELDYIFFKNKSKFETILKMAPKSKSGEGSKRIGKEKSFDNSTEEDDDLIDIENLTPAIMKEREKRDLEARQSSKKVKDYKIFNPRKRD